MTWAVIATGESLNPSPEEVASRVRHLPCVAVGNAYAIAPWARALVACDATWWRAHPEARAFAGEKWCANETLGIRRFRYPGISTNTNSGLLGLHYALTHGGAERVLLLGIDMNGTHYFGPYKNGCANTERSRFAFFCEQFRLYAERIPNGIEVINCSLDSALDVFPKMALADALAEAVA